MEQLSLFGEEKKVEVKEEKKVEKKAEQGKVEKKLKMVSLPVRVYAGPFTYPESYVMYGEEGEKMEDKLKKKLAAFDKDVKFDVSKIKGGYSLSPKFKAVTSLGDIEVASVKLGNTVSFITMKDKGTEIAKSFWQVHPEYMGCKFHQGKDTLIPYFEKEDDVKELYDTPIFIGYGKNFTDTLGFDGKEKVSFGEILSKYQETHPEVKDLYYKDDMFFPILTEKKISGKNNIKIKVPITVKLGAYDVNFTSDDFGKEIVSLEEIRVELEKEFAEYSKERTEMLYDDKHFCIAVLKSSKKGATVVASKEGYEYLPGKKITPFGMFSIENDIVNFQLKKKIPMECFYDIMDFFSATPKLEAAAQIFMDNESQYYVYYPKQVVTASTVEFERNSKLENNHHLVMDIHSHGMFPAFFSQTDDEDEKGTRLFMVIGKLDKFPEISTRCGMNGKFGKILFGDIFE